MRGICWACKRAEATESHHVWPIHLGGPQDGPQLPLCGNCHTEVHKLANAIIRGAAAEPSNPGVSALAKGAVQAHLRAQGTEVYQKADVRRVITMTRGLVQLAHIRKMERGIGSLEAYIVRLIEEDTDRIK